MSKKPYTPDEKGYVPKETLDKIEKLKESKKKKVGKVVKAR